MRMSLYIYVCARMNGVCYHVEFLFCWKICALCKLSIIIAGVCDRFELYTICPLLLLLVTCVCYRFALYMSYPLLLLTNARLMASALSLALDPTFGIHSHKTLDTVQPCHLLKPNWKPSSSHSISILTNISTQFLLQSVYACVCVCVRVCSAFLLLLLLFIYFIIYLFFK